MASKNEQKKKMEYMAKRVARDTKPRKSFQLNMEHSNDGTYNERVYNVSNKKEAIAKLRKWTKKGKGAWGNVMEGEEGHVRYGAGAFHDRKNK